MPTTNFPSPTHNSEEPHTAQHVAQRHHAARRRRRKRLVVTIATTLSVALLASAAAIAYAIHDLNQSIVRSDFTLPQVEDTFVDPGEQNILIMGMDSRVDQNGNPLPDEIYGALHAGGADDGGYNANVLMLLHMPADRSQTVGISIPRDDYVEIVGEPLGVSHSKIKEAYGLRMMERLGELRDSGEDLSEEEMYQQARAAGRQAQIETVSHFLGDVRIDHFVEMTMGGFYEVTQAVAPINVCLNQATEDIYSGAHFAAGEQGIDAQQAMSFVRQRRDTSEDGPYLTDLDRSRRQQAFMIALAEKLKSSSTFMNPVTVTSLMDATKNYVALDSNFDALTFLRIAKDAATHGAGFITLPIVEFDEIDGKSVNVVDIEQIHSIVASVFDGSYWNQPGAQEPPSDGSEAVEGEEGDGTGGDATQSETPDTPTTNEAGNTVYDSWDQPIRTGGVPCVN